MEDGVLVSKGEISVDISKAIQKLEDDYAKLKMLESVGANGAAQQLRLQIHRKKEIEEAKRAQGQMRHYGPILSDEEVGRRYNSLSYFDRWPFLTIGATICHFTGFLLCFRAAVESMGSVFTRQPLLYALSGVSLLMAGTLSRMWMSMNSPFRETEGVRVALYVWGDPNFPPEALEKLSALKESRHDIYLYRRHCIRNWKKMTEVKMMLYVQNSFYVDLCTWYI